MVLDVRDNLESIAKEGGPQASFAKEYGLSVDLVYRLEAVYGSVSDFLGQTHNNGPIIIERFRADLANYNNTYENMTGTSYDAYYGMPWFAGTVAERIAKLKLTKQDLQGLIAPNRVTYGLRSAFVTLRDADGPVQEAGNG